MSNMEGLLSKWTNVMKGWQYRWFVLDESAGLLSYYTSREKMIRGVRRGCVRLKGAVIGIDDDDHSTFTITVDSKTFHFQAKDRDEREKWIRCLEDAIMRHPFGYRCLNYVPTEAIRSVSDVLNFNKRLSEADGYLQLLIDETKAIESRLVSLSDENKTKCDSILSHSNNILEEVKHTIVLLQIANTGAHPLNGTLQQQSSTDSTSFKTESVPSEVPDTSYSSSEEDFFDAHSTSDPPSPSTRRPASGDISINNELDAVPSNNVENLNENSDLTLSLSPPCFLKPDGSLDYDALYDDPEDDVDYGLPIENQGSVVTHLLSQVKIGMDLTKVVLPIFILERRSLLEMFADYFAHPDMFVKIADFTNERDRMVQVVKWYLGSYHAGRKSSVAKKPYNPILGEIFQCYWDLPGTDTCGDQLLITDGPVSWCTGEQLTFVAEQVSHRPPISAFYAEHFNKKISFMAHVWTKSKFLGLSIAVHNIGNGKIDVLKYDEQYVVTFPNGYGRSILTVPWIELGGIVTIDCEKSGYRAVIEFVTKPFYGGKKHRIMCEVFAPSEKKPFLTVTGEWNGLMEAKWADGKIEQFIDVDSSRIIKKNVRPVDLQEDNESRKLWKDVTAGLRLNNVDHATNAKYNLENKQRMEAQQRKENGINWDTKLFQKSGEDGWVYIKPLRSRIASDVTHTCS